MIDCKEEDCEGEVPVGWHLDGKTSECDVCGHVYRVFGDETFVPETSEVFEWWAITEPGGDNPWL